MFSPTVPALTICSVIGMIGFAVGTAGATSPGRGVVGPACTERASIASFLDEAFAERSAATGVGVDGRLFEIFIAPDGSTWTFVVTDSRGVSCVLTAGRNWSARSVSEGAGAPGCSL